MLNIGTGEIIFIAVAALLILGPTKLPEFARTIGKLVRDFRRQTDDVRNVVEREFYKMDQQLQEPPAPLPQAAPDAIPHGDELDALAAGEHHAGELPSGTDALPTAEPDLSQVMKGAPPGELVVPRPVTSELAPPAPMEATSSPAPVEAAAPSTEPAPEKVTS
jgi:sec-independent protein translocase protein TatB